MRFVRCLWMVLVLVLALGCLPSARQLRADTASGIAVAANAALPLLVARFREAGFDELHRVKDAGGSAAEARDAILKVEATWEPIWKAWHALRVGHELWAEAIEKGTVDEVLALQAMRAAYCELARVWPVEIPGVPLAPVRCP